MKKLAICIIASAGISAGAAQAQCYPADPCYNGGAAAYPVYSAHPRYYSGSSRDRMHSYSIGLEFSKYNYKEPNYMELSGMFYGVSGEYVNRGLIKSGEFSTYIAGQIRYMTGDVDYDGFLYQPITNTTTPLEIEDIKNYYAEGRVLAGLTMNAAPQFDITPFTGFGVRYLIDRGDKYQYSYRRQSTYFYIPLGLTADFDLYDGWMLSATGEYDFLIKGIQKSRLGQAVPWALWEIDNSQDEGYGLRFDVKLEKQINPGVAFFVQPFVKYWNIKESDASYAGTLSPDDWFVAEPKNRTLEWGVGLGLTF